MISALSNREYTADLAARPSDEAWKEPMDEPKPESVEKMRKYAKAFADKSGTFLHPMPEITDAVVLGLASHIDRFGRPLCPCNFYPEKDETGSWPEGLYLPRDEEVK